MHKQPGMNSTHGWVAFHCTDWISANILPGHTQINLAAWPAASLAAHHPCGMEDGFM